MSTSSLSRNIRTQKPKWLKVPFPGGAKYQWLKDKSSTLQLATVCEEARCPNIGECWNTGTATFMLMGDTCTRGCRFCSVNTAKIPASLDSEEPRKLADTIRKMELEYVVLTSVDRDDLPDQGAGHLARSIRAIQRACPELMIEMLIPDFCGDESMLQIVMDSKPTVLSHNLETVKRLTPKVRDPRAGYQQSLDVLKRIKTHSDIHTKSSLMLGLGETKSEVLEAMEDLRAVDVEFLTLGQYLQPTRKHLKVHEFVTPESFEEYRELGEAMGFDYVASGPLVRSSYRAAEFYIQRSIRSKYA